MAYPVAFDELSVALSYAIFGAGGAKGGASVPPPPPTKAASKSIRNDYITLHGNADL